MPEQKRDKTAVKFQAYNPFLLNSNFGYVQLLVDKF